jgi:signal transduction histidine kinase
VDAVRAGATIALEHRHLQDEAQERMAELRASRQRLVAAGNAERRRIERNLHDGAQARLVALGLQLSRIQRRIRADPVEAEQLATSASEELVVLEISDDGVGGADPSRGTGLRGLADRVEALSGSLRVRDRRTGGTVVTADLPDET